MCGGEAAGGGGPSGGVYDPFPAKLHAMLAKAESDDLTSIVSWRPHGRAFCVHKPEQFVHEILPYYFRQTKFTSFQRQLNLYGFSRITKGIDAGSYYHERFLRGQSHLASGMRRTKIKGAASRNKKLAHEPNFYAMTSISAALPSKDMNSKNLLKIKKDDEMKIEKAEYSSNVPPRPFPLCFPCPCKINNLKNIDHQHSLSSFTADEVEPKVEGVFPLHSSSSLLSPENIYSSNACNEHVSTEGERNNETPINLDHFSPPSVYCHSPIKTTLVEANNNKMQDFEPPYFSSSLSLPKTSSIISTKLQNGGKMTRIEEKPFQPTIALEGTTMLCGGDDGCAGTSNTDETPKKSDDEIEGCEPIDYKVNFNE